MTATAPPARQTRPGREHLVWKVAFAVVYATAVLTVGWLLTQWVFTLTGRPPALVAYLLSVAVAIVLAGNIAAVFGRVTGRFRDDPDLIWDDLGAALDRIARGDFSVRLRQPRRGVLADVVASVNNMAAGLGSVEQQRQEFISNVSHEIQSPLTSIGGFAALLREPGLDETTRAHYLDVISSECARLSHLSDNLLRLSALESGSDLDHHPYRLDEQLRSVVLALEPQWTAKSIEMEVRTEPATIDADADMLRQVWINLVQNATKYTPDSGTVTVTQRTSADAYLVEVSDTGTGIDAADLPRVFERFFRADRARSGEGNGLGLSLVKRVVELHEGEVRVVSEPGLGSTFTVTLPLGASSEAAGSTGSAVYTALSRA